MEKYNEFVNEAMIDGLELLGEIRKPGISIADNWRNFMIETRKLPGNVIEFYERGKVPYKEQLGNIVFKPIFKRLKCTAVNFDRLAIDLGDTNVLLNDDEIPNMTILDSRNNPHLVELLVYQTIRYYGKPVEKEYKVLPDMEKWWFSNSKVDKKDIKK